LNGGKISIRGEYGRCRLSLARAVLQTGSRFGRPLSLDSYCSALEEITLRSANLAADLLTGFNPARMIHSQRQPPLVRHSNLQQPRQGKQKLAW
jgi:hypothetical protein